MAVGFAAIAVGLAMAAVAVADGWKFADAAHGDTRYNNTRHGNTRNTVIRGQYSTTAGRSVPTLDPAPAYAAPAGQTGPAYAQPAPAYGQGPGFPPPLTGDAGGQGPYVTNPTDTGPTPLFGVEPDGMGAMPYIPLTPMVQETQTGRLMMGVGVNSEAGLVGSIVLDEQNFDWRRFPRSFEEIRNATAWRGAGQRFRLEAVPGTQVQRYMASFTEPYLMNTDVSLSLSAFYFTRFYEYWHEQRMGGRVALGYHFSHALTGSLAYRGASINISDPYQPAPAELLRVVGDSVLHGFQGKLAHDTRDSAFLATEGHLIEASFEQVVGTYMYPRFELDVRKYFHFNERADQSGRHVVSLNARMGITGSDTPIYDNFYAGGFSTIRGFYFRGASPRDQATGVIVGGHFMLLASIEYLFPITADDMLRGVVFCDTGTVEPSIDDWDDTYRVSPGFGLRIVVPAMGPAPIALDFAFPVSTNPGDRKQVFSFFVGFAR
jgi:outer membrane protein insertion porin family